MERVALLRSLFTRSSVTCRRLLFRPKNRPRLFSSNLHRYKQQTQFRQGSSIWRWQLTTSLVQSLRLRRNFSFSSKAVSTSSQPAAQDVGNDITEKHGFEKISEQFISECKSNAILYKHKKTGAEVISVSNDDENKVFGIVFRTPPKDSTGIPHILEHSVLCGSKKYPLKAPFVELLKGSLNTFLNAFTYPDRTCYPVASTNMKMCGEFPDISTRGLAL